MSWTIEGGLGSLIGRVGLSLGAVLGSCSACLGAVSGASWVVLEVPGCVLGPRWCPLGGHP